MRIALVVVLIVAGLAAVGGYFWVTKHERASQSSIVSKVSDQEVADNVACVKRADNGSVWWCAGEQGKKAACWVVHVPVYGSTKIRDGRSRCKQVASLATIMKGA